MPRIGGVMVLNLLATCWHFALFGWTYPIYSTFLCGLSWNKNISEQVS